MTKKSKRYGWYRDQPEVRDIQYKAIYLAESEIPSIIDLRGNCPEVLDQGQLGSCTANAIANAHLFNQMKQQSSNLFTPSRLFIYFNERVMNNTVNEDSGAALRDGIKTINQHGVCPESQWPYDINNFTTKPNDDCYTEACNHQSIAYQRINQDLYSLKHCLAEGYPFVLGIIIHQSFESKEVAKTGKVSMPLPSEVSKGGHAVLAVGYNDTDQTFTIMNSWGKKWGQAGFFTIPYAYLTNPSLAADFWTIRTIEI